MVDERHDFLLRERMDRDDELPHETEKVLVQ
jgi:hypothetical protein